MFATEIPRAQRVLATEAQGHRDTFRKTLPIQAFILRGENLQRTVRRRHRRSGISLTDTACAIPCHSIIRLIPSLIRPELKFNSSPTRLAVRRR